MFAVVGKLFSWGSVGTPDWYLKSTWTSEQRDEFERWLIREGMLSHRKAVVNAREDREQWKWVVKQVLLWIGLPWAHGPFWQFIL